MKKRILVIGGSGFIGSHLADKLSKDGHKVIIFDKKKSKYINPEQIFIKGDILNIKKLNEAVKKVNIIFHFGGIANIEYSKNNPKECLEANIIGTNNLLNIISKMKNKPKIFFGSTLYIYSNYGSFYRISKEACEKLIYEYARDYQINYLILRFGTVYGTRSDINNSIFHYITKILSHKKNSALRFKSSGNELREFIHVKDVANICSDLIYKKNNEMNKSFIITGLDKFKVSEIIELIMEIADKKTKVLFSKNNSNHYRLTPYSSKIEITEKIVPKTYVDIGSGILDIIDSLKKTNK
tara:strand:+ start:8068 stop:8958 length:891 start_codon:yes stop_codon:yes gene_type:complete